MPFPTVLEIVIGTVYVYFIFSMMAAGINEWYARLTHRRGNVLRWSITQLLGSTPAPPGPEASTLAQEFHAHPLIQGLADGQEYPSYIPAAHFSMALIDLAIGAPDGTKPVEPRHQINGTNQSLTLEEQRVITALIAEESSIRVVQARIEKWFTDSGERISGRYKRATYQSLLVFSLLISVAFRVDSIALVQHLYQDPVARQVLAARATTAVEAKNDAPVIPIGWGQPQPWWFFGIPITALMLTLGAPFWFELLNRLVNLRQAGAPPNNAEQFSG